MNKQRHAFLVAASLAVGVLACGSVTAGEVGPAPDPALQLARDGADDAPGDDHGGRHASEPVLQMARHGADDPAGDDRGDDRRGG